MLRITIKGAEAYDESTEEFVYSQSTDVELEHSLVSLSKWEAVTEKPFLSAGSHSPQEVLEYIKAMVITPDFPMEKLAALTQDDLTRINTYVNAKQTATTFGDMPSSSGPKEVITSELIYYWMIGFNIPFECQFWHLNRLFALIRICNLKNTKPKKMTTQQIAQRNRELNEQRRAQLNTSG